MKKNITVINLLGVFILLFILLGAYVFQFIHNELPCPLCLMQRMAVIGAAFGLALNLRYGVDSKHYGISILSALLGVGISIRHMLLHICCADGRHGSTFFGLHLYTWALLVFLICILVIALLLMNMQQFKDHKRSSLYMSPLLKGLCKNALWLLLLLALTNFFTTLLICGVGFCTDHPVSYQLLKGKWL